MDAINNVEEPTTPFEQGRLYGPMLMDAGLALTGVGLATTSSRTTVRVGRWMNPSELERMRETGLVQLGQGGTHRVAMPDDPTAYKAAPKGDVYATYDVPIDVLKPAGKDGWAQIPGPDSPYGKLAKKRGEELEIPAFQNLQVEQVKK